MSFLQKREFIATIYFIIMEGNKIEQLNNIPQNVEEAVKVLIGENKTEEAVQFLRENPDEITEFCYQVFESYQEGDKTGLAQISKIIEELL